MQMIEGAGSSMVRNTTCARGRLFLETTREKLQLEPRARKFAHLKRARCGVLLTPGKMSLLSCTSFWRTQFEVLHVTQVVNDLLRPFTEWVVRVSFLQIFD